jgi:hypothetical protein
MKNDQQRRAHSEADQHTMPNSPVAPHLFVIVSRHQNDCIAALSESKYRPARRTSDFVVACREL